MKHEPMLKDTIKKRLGFDYKEFVEKNRPVSILEFDDKIIAPFFGWKNREDYYYSCSCIHRMP
jgi:predicted alpha/beta-fold hydrolase